MGERKGQGGGGKSRDRKEREIERERERVREIRGWDFRSRKSDLIRTELRDCVFFFVRLGIRLYFFDVRNGTLKFEELPSKERNARCFLERTCSQQSFVVRNHVKGI